jgi:hypothetical protein
MTSDSARTIKASSSRIEIVPRDFLGAGDVFARPGRVEVDIHTALEWITLNWVSLSILGKLIYLYVGL